MRSVGLHIRVGSSLTDVVEKAVGLSIPLMQCFVVDKTTGYLIRPTADDKQQFISLRKQHNINLYVHGSYWINLSSVVDTRHYSLYRELKLAQELEATHFILHPGSAKGGSSKMQGIDALARSLNILISKNYPIQYVLENTAHGNLSIGGDLQDFYLLLEKIDNPDAVSFCIDTAHAYSYGYDIVHAQGRAQFFDLIKSTIGFNKVDLLHINDTVEALGSKLDKHQLLGKGTIGIEPLKACVQDERLRAAPIILELPVTSEEEEQLMLTMVRSWL